MELSLATANTNMTNKVNFNNMLLSQFIDYLDNVQKITAKNYIVCLNPFFKYLQDNNITNPQKEDIKAYKRYLITYINPKTNKPITQSTKQQYLRAVKQFIEWLYSEGYYENIASSIRNFKLKRDINNKSSKDAFTESDIQVILNSIDRTTAVGKRDYAIILLAVTGGLRINELSNIDIQDLELINGKCKLKILGKGHTDKDNYIKVIPAVYEVIQDYLKTRDNIKPTDALFTSTSNRALNKRITKQSISQIIKNRLRQAGYNSPSLTAHSLRHTSITLLLNAGADIYTAQMHARHQDPKTTEIYAHKNIKETAHTEQDVYNQIFKPTESEDKREDIKQNINKLTKEQQIQVLNYINNLKLCIA